MLGMLEPPRCSSTLVDPSSSKYLFRTRAGRQGCSKALGDPCSHVPESKNPPRPTCSGTLRSCTTLLMSTNCNMLAIPVLHPDDLRCLDMLVEWLHLLLQVSFRTHLPGKICHWRPAICKKEGPTGLQPCAMTNGIIARLFRPCRYPLTIPVTGSHSPAIGLWW